MRVVTDENIPLICEAGAALGEVVAMPGRAMSAELVREADCLFVRSVAQVDSSLLEGSNVKFVGTATIGIDHVDTGWLAENDIAFSSAPGSNANSVSEYVFSSLLTIAHREGFRLRDRTLGIIGVGNVGSRIAGKARALGMRTLLNDPPRAEREGDDDFSSLDEVLAEADIVTCHTPLTRDGSHATKGLAGESFFARFRKGGIFVNTSRGQVHDRAALIRAIDKGVVGPSVIDVWENEPDISLDLLERVTLGTPHVAGYSYDGKVNGTAMIVNAARAYFGIAGEWDSSSCMPEPDVPSMEVDGAGRDPEDVVHEAVETICNTAFDDAGMRILPEMSDEERLAYFDDLRKGYHPRREFQNTRILLNGGEPEAVAVLAGFGFSVEIV